MAGISGKSGRKKKNVKKVQVCTSIDSERFGIIEELAESSRWTIASAISYLIELGLEGYEKSNANNTVKRVS